MDNKRVNAANNAQQNIDNNSGHDQTRQKVSADEEKNFSDRVNKKHNKKETEKRDFFSPFDLVGGLASEQAKQNSLEKEGYDQDPSQDDSYDQDYLLHDTEMFGFEKTSQQVDSQSIINSHHENYNSVHNDLVTSHFKYTDVNVAGNMVSNVQSTRQVEQVDRVESALKAMAEKIMVRAGGMNDGSEVRLVLKDNILPVQDIQLVRNGGELKVTLNVNTQDAYQTMLQHQAVLHKQLSDRFSGENVSVNLAMSSDGQSDQGQSNSHQYQGDNEQNDPLTINQDQYKKKK